MDELQYNSVGEQYEYFVKTGAMRQIDEHTTLDMIGNVFGKSVLDLACGFGYFSQELYRRGASKIVGVDISDQMIEIARKKAKLEGFPIQYEVFDVARMGRIGRFDIVSAIWLFNYASSPDILYSMFKTCIDNLKDNGVLVAYTVNPNYSLRKGNYTKYGFNILSEKIIGENSRMEGEFVSPRPTKITFYRWSKEYYENIIRNVGFSEVEWIEPELAESDIKNHPGEFWDIFRANHLQTGLICRV